MKHSKHFILIVAVTVIVVLVFFFFLTKNRFSADSPAIVNKKEITRQEFEKELSYRRNFFLWAKQDLSKISTLEKDVLNKLIDKKIILEYAKSKKIIVSGEELQERFRSSIGSRTEGEYLAKIKEMYGMDKEAHLENLKLEILKEKIQMEVNKPLKSWLDEQKETSEIIIAP